MTGLQWNVGKFEFPSQVKPVPRMSSPTQAMKKTGFFQTTCVYLETHRSISGVTATTSSLASSGTEPPALSLAKVETPRLTYCIVALGNVR